MPSTSKKQHNFMAAVAHSPEFAKKAGVPQSVGKEFNKADKGRTFSKGGDMKSKKMAMGGMASQAPTSAKVGAAMDPKKAAMIAQAMKRRPAMAAPKVGPMPTGMKKGGPAKKMATGGMTMVEKGGKMVPDFAADGVGKMAKGGAAKKMNMGGMAYARGGGIEVRGKTKGTMVKMAKGGSAKKYC